MHSTWAAPAKIAASGGSSNPINVIHEFAKRLFRKRKPMIGTISFGSSPASAFFKDRKLQLQFCECASPQHEHVIVSCIWLGYSCGYVSLYLYISLSVSPHLSTRQLLPFIVYAFQLPNQFCSASVSLVESPRRTSSAGFYLLALPFRIWVTCVLWIEKI